MKRGSLFFFLLVMCAGAVSMTLEAVETQPAISSNSDESESISATPRLSINGNILSVLSSLHNYKAFNKDDVYSQTRALFDLSAGISQRVTTEMCFGVFGIWDKQEQTLLSNVPYNGQMNIFRADIKVKDFLGSGIGLTIGRQFMGGVEDAIFYYGPTRNGRFLEVTALDGIRAERAAGPLKIVLAGGAEANMGTGGAAEPPRRQNAFALELYNNKVFPSQNIKMFFYERLQEKSSQNDQLVCYGFESTGKLPAPGFSYLATVALNGGTNGAPTDTLSENGYYNGYLWRAIGYYDTKPSWGDLSLNGGYVFVSGDDTNGDGKESGFRRIGRDCFYTMAYMTYEIISDGDPEGVENVVIPFAGLKYTPAVFDRRFSLSGNYSYLKTDKPIAGLDDKGSEFDVRVSFAMDRHNVFRVIGAKFWPRGVIAKNFGSNPMEQVVFEYELKF